MKKFILTSILSSTLCLTTYGEETPSNPPREIAQWGVGVDFGDDYYDDDDDDDVDVNVWVGPGYYNGFWYDNYDEWHHHHGRGHHHNHRGHGHHDSHGGHHRGGHGGHHGGGHHK